MARKKLSMGMPFAEPALAKRLAEELKKDESTGQPFAYELELAEGRLRVTVIWDQFDRMPLDERTAVVLRAYSLAFPSDGAPQIALASGLTVPEATEAGMLPYQVTTALRASDRVTIDGCRKAMFEEGASTLFGPETPQLRFATREEADDCRQRLIRRLPGSDDVWVVNREITVQDTSRLRESAVIAER